jgi:hypothetical protein
MRAIPRDDILQPIVLAPTVAALPSSENAVAPATYAPDNQNHLYALNGETFDIQP